MANKSKVNNRSNKKSVFGSMMFRAWLYFLVLIGAVFLVFWCSFRLIYTANFSSSYLERVRQSSENLTKIIQKNGYALGSEEFMLNARNNAVEQRMTIIVFTFKPDKDILNPYEATIEYYTNPLHASGDIKNDFAAARNIISYKFLVKMKELGPSGNFVETQKNDNAITAIFGEKLLSDKGETIYLYTATSLLINDPGVSIMIAQLKVIALICLVFAMIFSLIIAWQFVMPVRKLTATARKAETGDMKVKYSGSGFNEYEELADALNDATAEMAKAENFRRDFLTNVTHDLRTPLTLVKANAEMIRDISGDNKEKREKNARVIINEVDRLTLLVEDILDLSKLQSGVVEFSKTRASLSLIVSDVICQFGVLAETGRYIFDNYSEENLFVECDKKRLYQVVYNLIGNAINYVGEDKKIVTRAYKTQAGKVRFEVSDSGMGIPEDEIDKVWERYYRSNRNARNVVGSGVGLSIVKNILIGFKAEYGIDSVQGKGTTFWFELPFAED